MARMAGGREGPAGGRVTDAHGRSWRVGTEADVAWIAESTSPGMTITAAIPPVFEAYATVVLPDSGDDQKPHNRAMIELLAGDPADQQWWLGYLATGDDDLVCPGVTMAALPKVSLYAGWNYVLIQAGPQQAAAWRRNPVDGLWWRDVLPDLMFPADRSWLVATLTDDEWACAGGPASLMDRFLGHHDLRARPVRRGEDATPPGHHAF